MKVLLVEDEPKVADFVCSGLSSRGFEVTHARNGKRALEAARSEAFAAIVLDIMLPIVDGLTVLKHLRSEGNQTPVILLTARNELGDRIEGLSLGADDFLAKPFYVEELAARLQALIRRAAGDKQNLLHVGSLSLDRIARRASCHGQEIDLTTREYSLLEYLMRSAGQVFTRGQILEHVWGYDFDPTTNVVDVCIKRIRHKIASIEDNEALASPIESVRGVGYRFRQSD
jgi:DNA-binding response OmpR family regulator